MLESDGKSDLFYSANSIWLSWAQFIVGVTLYVISYYICDSSIGTWNSSTFGKEEITKGMIGILLLPIGLIGWYQPLSRFLSHAAFRFAGVLVICFCFIVTLFALGCIYFVEWQVSNWIAWDLNLETAVQVVQGIYLTLTLWLTAIALVFILIRMILHRQLYGEDGRTYALNEAVPLIGSSQDEDGEELLGTGRRMGGGGSRIDGGRAELMDRFWEFAGIFLFFWVFIPIFLWLNCVLMSDWHRFLPESNDYHLAYGLTTDPWTKYFAFDCTYLNGSVDSTITCYARLYYDIQIYMEFIFVVALFSYIVSKYRSARVFVHRRLLMPWSNMNTFDILPISMTIGEICFWILWFIMMFTIGYYFTAIHAFDDTPTKSTLEVWARYIGILSMQCAAFGMFTITRIRLWQDCFLVSFEHLVSYHRCFMYGFVLLSYLHGILWISYFNVNTDGYTWDDNKPFGILPFSYHGSNWTIPVAYQYTIIFLPIFYGVFSFYMVRRKYFELFYYTHLFAAVVSISFILWHATQSWRYMIPPLMLYAIDRMIRLYNSSLLCCVEVLTNDFSGGAGGREEEVERTQMAAGCECTKLSFTIADYDSRRKTAGFKNLPFKCGQYVFVAISNISLYEWHPFTIASGEHSKEVSLYVKNMDVGNRRCWSNLLYELANAKTPVQNVQIQVDGPYGKPFEYQDYGRIVLVAGGIGITPCHSIFDTMLSRAIAGSIVPFVELIWVVRDVSQITMFLNTWQKFEENIGLNRFGVRLFVTRGVVQESSFQLVVPGTNMMYTQGRPQWDQVLGTLLSNNNGGGDSGDDIIGNDCLVFACGPMGLVNDAERVAVGNGAHFYSESFEF